MQSPTGSQIATSLLRLRQDAIERGYGELAIAYGWSVIRIGAEEIERRAALLEAYRGSNSEGR